MTTEYIARKNNFLRQRAGIKSSIQLEKCWHLEIVNIQAWEYVLEVLFTRIFLLPREIFRRYL